MIKPIGNRILLEQMVEDEKIGSIYVPEASRGTSKYSKVVAISDTCPIVGVEVGDTVLRDEHAGYEALEEDGKKYMLVHGDSISANIYTDKKIKDKIKKTKK